MASKRVGIIGAGFTGLAIAYRLLREGFDVTIFDSEKEPGGLAVGFEQKRWKWSLEKHYHHWFTNDQTIIDFCDELRQKYVTVRPKTSTYIGGGLHQLDSAVSLLQFDQLNFLDRLRTGAVIAYLKLISNWKSLEKYTASQFLLRTMGEQSWNKIWKPLFVKKFSNYFEDISAAWFWARIKKRTESLVYPEGGYLKFAKLIEQYLIKKGVKFYYETQVNSINKDDGTINIVSNDVSSYDFVVSTLPFGVTSKIVSKFPQSYIKKTNNYFGIGVVNLVLVLRKSFLEDGTYWLNINDMDMPFLAVVEHTNFMDKANYNNEHIVYIANYLDSKHEYFSLSAKQLLKIYLPHLQMINSNFSEKDVIGLHKFQADFAQPVVTTNYSKKILPFETPIENLYVCNMQQVYPWDRGTNYSVEMGFKLADIICNKCKS